MNAYYLSEEHRKGHTLIDISAEMGYRNDGCYRLLVSRDKVYKVHHTLIIDDPGIDSRIAQEFIKNAQDDNPVLEQWNPVVVDAASCIYIFWCERTTAPKQNFNEYGADPDIWKPDPGEVGPALDAIEAGHLNRLAEHAAATGDRSADTEGICDYCNGSGEYAPGKMCSECDGTGRAEQAAAIYEPDEFPDGEFPSLRRWLDPDWGKL
jgi:hypothetical protein